MVVQHCAQKCELTYCVHPFHHVVKQRKSGNKQELYSGLKGQRSGSSVQFSALGYGKAEASWQKGVMGESDSAQAVSKSVQKPGDRHAFQRLISLTYFHQLDVTSFS